MIGILYAWTFFASAGVLAGARDYFRGRPSVAIGAAMAVSLASATWLSIEIAEVNVDTRIALAVIFLVAFCLHPLGRFRFPWNWLDAVAISLMCTGLVSDWRVSGLNAEAPIRLYGEFLLPYFTGRFIAMRQDAARRSATWIAGAGLLISIAAIAESFFGSNFWELCFATKDDLVAHTRAMRYDVLYRATGPTRHPIFLGVILLLLIPWCICLIERVDSKTFRRLGWIALLLIITGTLATVSRGPVLSLLIAAIAAIAIAWPKSFKWIAGSITAAALVTVLYLPQIISFVDSTESIKVRSQAIEVNNENKLYSGTRNRVLIFEIYSPLIIKGGFFGFGTQAVSSFPPNIPGLPASAEARETLGVVDNSYLLTGLRFGWIGLSLFLILIFGSIVTAIRLRRSAGMILYPDGPAFLTALASCLIGVSFVMLTVFSSFDFMFWVYFHCGVVAGLASLRDSLLRGDIHVAA